LDAAEMLKRLDAGHHTAQTRTQYEEALYLGVRGIPSFIIGRYFFSGAQPYELFQRVAQRVLAEQSGLVLPS
jgi:predicted DsbA family dithiol-disulfide isomerase